MPFYGDPRDLDTFNDDFDDEHYGYVDGINDGSKAQAPPRSPSSDDWQSEFTVPEIEPCPKCSEPAVAAWDHREECPHYEEMKDLPF